MTDGNGALLKSLWSSNNKSQEKWLTPSPTVCACVSLLLYCWENCMSGECWRKMTSQKCRNFITPHTTCSRENYAICCSPITLKPRDLLKMILNSEWNNVSVSIALRLTRKYKLLTVKKITLSSEKLKHCLFPCSNKDLSESSVYLFHVDIYFWIGLNMQPRVKFKVKLLGDMKLDYIYTLFLLAVGNQY